MLLGLVVVLVHTSTVTTWPLVFVVVLVHTSTVTTWQLVYVVVLVYTSTVTTWPLVYVIKVRTNLQEVQIIIEVKHLLARLVHW